MKKSRLGFKLMFLVIWLVSTWVGFTALWAIVPADNQLYRGAMVLFAVAFAGLSAVYMYHYILRPILKLNRQIKEIAEGKLERLDAAGTAELDDIANSFNQAFARIGLDQSKVVAADAQSAEKEEADDNRKVPEMYLVKTDAIKELSLSYDLAQYPSLIHNYPEIRAHIFAKLKRLLGDVPMLLYDFHTKLAYLPEILSGIPGFEQLENVVPPMKTEFEFLEEIWFERILPPTGWSAETVKSLLLIACRCDRSYKGQIVVGLPREQLPKERAGRFLSSLGREIALVMMLRSAVKDFYDRQLANLRDFAKVWEVWHPFLQGHSERVSQTAQRLAAKVSLSEEEQRAVGLAAYWHDLGEIAISDQILHKDGPLSDSEWGLLKSHPIFSTQLQDAIEVRRKTQEFIHAHHERLEGGGYPRDLSGAKVPLGAQIIAIADAYHSMSSDRPWRRDGYTLKEITERLKEQSGKQFHEKIVTAMLEAIAEDEDYS